ncbi:MAG TPA: cupin domain-containing protein [Egibacteraceae bacterium]|nr:cupin domain-containing protein [Egibacteraceae bacterium]
MRIWHASDAKRFEPEGHYGGLEVADVVTKEMTGNFVIQASYCPPGGGGDKHWHDEDGQVFFIVQGQLSFDTGEEQFTLSPMEAVYFEPSEPHATRNETDDDCFAIVVTVATPPA